MAASASTCAAASARKAGPAKTAPSLAARTTVPARGCVSKGSVRVTATLEATTVQSRDALRTARVAGCVSTASVCAKSPSPGKTAWSGGVWTTARTRGCASTGRASAGPGTWGRTARWSTVPTTAARRESARMDFVSARTALLEMTATRVGNSFCPLCQFNSLGCCQMQKADCLTFVFYFQEAETGQGSQSSLTFADSVTRTKWLRAEIWAWTYFWLTLSDGFDHLSFEIRAAAWDALPPLVTPIFYKHFCSRLAGNISHVYLGKKKKGSQAK